MIKSGKEKREGRSPSSRIAPRPDPGSPSWNFLLVACFVGLAPLLTALDGRHWTPALLLIFARAPRQRSGTTRHTIRTVRGLHTHSDRSSALACTVQSEHTELFDWIGLHNDSSSVIKVLSSRKATMVSDGYFECTRICHYIPWVKQSLYIFFFVRDNFKRR